MASFVSTPQIFRKLPSRVPLRSETKQVIMNVYTKLRDKHPKESILSITSMCAEETGVCISTVKKLKCEAKGNNGKPRSPLRTQKTPARRRLTRDEKFDSFTLMAIKNKVHRDFFAKNEHVTVEKVVEAVKSDEDFPNICQTTMRHILKATGFVYQRRHRNSMLIDREDIVRWRAKYLRSIQAHRQNKRNIVYLDETWVNGGHHKEFVWQDSTVHSKKQAFLEGLTTGPTAPTGKGKRLILTHAGNEDGFIEGAVDIFEGKKSGDYHEEMDGRRFENWFETKLLPNIKPESVIVMDNASYHSVKVEAIPTKSKTKAVMQDWLTSKGIEWTPTMQKKHLIELVDVVRSTYDAYRIDQLAEKHGHTVLRLPPYHCELNPIELVWSQVKDYVAKNNKLFTMKEIRRLLPEGIQLVTPERWKANVEHVVKEEQRMRNLDGLIENEIQSFVINIGEDSDDESDATSSIDGNISGIEEID